MPPPQPQPTAESLRPWSIETVMHVDASNNTSMPVCHHKCNLRSMAWAQGPDGSCSDCLIIWIYWGVPAICYLVSPSADHHNHGPASLLGHQLNPTVSVMTYFSACLLKKQKTLKCEPKHWPFPRPKVKLRHDGFGSFENLCLIRILPEDDLLEMSKTEFTVCRDQSVLL